MHYPWWYVPFATSPMVIALVAVVHVLVAHYAVGGGLFLAVETAHAHRTRNADYLGYLKRHARFFILITVVLGAISGVGIWWTIGLASPLATETLIHAFVFAWAVEWVFFLVELVAAFVFYYCWGRLDRRTHVVVGWIYAIAAWLSLLVITAILAFMLHPGEWPRDHNFWSGFFNPQFLPQLVARTGGALLLSSLFVYLHAAFRIRDRGLRNFIEYRSARPALLGAILLTIGGVLWYANLPPSAAHALEAASALNIFMALLFAITAAVFVMLYFGPYRNPGWLTPGFALLLFTFGLAAIATGEFVREAIRKPFIVYHVVLGNQIRYRELPEIRRRGYLESGVWTRAYLARYYPQVMKPDGSVAEDRLLELPRDDQIRVGKVLFMHHCNDCHAVGAGYAGMNELVRGWTPEMLGSLARQPERYHFFMPPWSGTDAEAEVLARYLHDMAPPLPEGLFPPVEQDAPFEPLEAQRRDPAAQKAVLAAEGQP